MIKINRKQIALKLFLFWLKYTIIVCGFMSLLYFWGVDLKQLGLGKFFLGGAIWIFATAIAEQIKYKNNEE